MAGSENTPKLELIDPPEDRHCHVLICAGQAVTTALTDGVRLTEIASAIEVGRGSDMGLVPRFSTADPHMSRAHARFRMLNFDTVALRDLGSSNGTFVDGEKLNDERVLRSGAIIFMGAHVFVYRRMRREDFAAVEREMASPFCPVPTTSPTMARLTSRLRQLARSEVEILLGGETGVGKEVFAEAIHRESRRSGPLVAINCAALPDNLIESELFGYARGAHSTADQGKSGLIERAENGTLFLDEIGEMPAGAQSKLLRFLQDRQLLSLGTTRHRILNVRIIAATSRLVAPNDSSPGIRLDLAARLGPEQVVIPPLRERPEDIGIFARYFLREQPSAFDIRAYRALFLHRWPGNVRELEKTLRTARVLSEGLGRVTFGDLGTDAQRSGGGEDSGRDPVEFPTVRMAGIGTPLPGHPPATFRARLESKPTPEMLTTLLERHRGNVGHVAREIGRQRTLVWRWLRIAGIDASRYRPEGVESSGSPLL